MGEEYSLEAGGGGWRGVENPFLKCNTFFFRLPTNRNMNGQSISLAVFAFALVPKQIATQERSYPDFYALLRTGEIVLSHSS